MGILEVLKHFYQRMTLITSYQRAAKELADSELTRLCEQAEMANGDAELLGKQRSTQNMFYINPADGTHAFYGQKRSTIEDMIEATQLHKNKQYQWLLAEAYEEYEDFLELAYANIGFNNPEFWPLSDFGNISLTEINGKSWDWYLQQSRNKKGIPESLLNYFRNKLPKFALLERENKLEKDLRLSIALISQLRHHIVHTGGKVIQRETFIKKVLNSVGLYNGGNPTEENRKLVEMYFLGGKHTEVIGLLEVPLKHESALPAYINVFDYLTRQLLASAHALAFAIKEYQDTATE
jgi:hypothetical protein